MTTLTVGDIAIVEYQGQYGSAEYSFVLLRDIDASTTINFTNKGYIDENADSPVNDGYYNGGEFHWGWTSGASLSAGTVITVSQIPDGSQGGGKVLGTSAGSITQQPTGSTAFDWRLDFSNQITAFQGTFDPTGAGMTELFGINVSGVNFPGFDAGTQTEWNGVDLNGPNADSSGLPPGLTPGMTAVALTDPSGEFNDGNTRYTGPLTGTQNQLLAAISNPANWTFSGDTAPTTPGTFTVLAPGASPIVNVNAGSLLNEGADDVVTTAELETSDADTADGNLVYSLDTDVANGTLYLDNDNSNTFNAGDTDLGVGSTFTQTDIINGNLRYEHNGGETTTDSFQFDVTDGSNTVANQTFVFTITPVNDAAVIANVDGDSVTYFEIFNGAPLALQSDTAATISDIDSANFDGGQLTFSWNGVSLPEDQLSLANEGFGSGQLGIAGTDVFVSGIRIGFLSSNGVNGADLVVTLNDNATPERVEMLIEKARYANSGGDNPSTASRTLNVTLNDGDGGTSGVSQITVNIAAENDAPSQTGAPTDITVDENALSNVDLSALTLADPDSATVTLTLNVSSGFFAIPADGAGVGAGVVEALTIPTQITLTGAPADISTYLDNASAIRYIGELNVEGDNAATLTVLANDGDGSGDVTLATINIDITPANEPAVAQDDAISTDEATVLTGNVFADNGSGADADNESDPFAVTEVNGNAASVGTPILLASGASLTLNANGTFSYDPNGQFDALPAAGSGASNLTGTDSFTYTITGGDTATVTVTVNGLDGDDLALGTFGADTLDGGIGTDTLEAGDGDDVLIGGAGGDTLNGGSDTGGDTVSYAGSAAWVNVSLQTGFAGGGAGSHAIGDSFIGIEHLAGSAFGDRLKGDAGANRLSGDAGDDTLLGSGGADTLDGGNNSDTVDYGASDAAVRVVWDELTLAWNTAGGGAGNFADGDVLLGIENLAGSRFADTLVGDGSDNVLEGRLGADVLDGAGGTDTALYASSAGFVNVSLETGYAGGGSGSHAIGDTWSNIENVIGSNHDDLINGDDNANALSGGMGDDLLRGRGGADALDGGSGSDTASYSDSATFVSVNLETGATTGGGVGNDAEGDTFVSIENLQGTSFADILTGDDGDNILEGRTGADSLTGGAGSDTASYATSAGFVNVSLLTGYMGGGSGSHAFGDILVSIENLVGSTHNDLLNGDNNANRLDGGLGNDTLTGNGGADTFVFAEGFGADVVLDFEDGVDRFDFTGLSNPGTLSIADLGADAVITYGLDTITVLNAAGLVSLADFDLV
ncbi:beta strand repeat-containing protein [Ponticoccus alexandrii]|uniref:Cadherin domain-containing protein n=1 Tax=Ponticoccus alexandrii TaxID=1943633 RepID=A0ABX7FBV3_9RHOB|nr:cadherin-like domain-containing protein [Ponticoccus alexandrii]QRF68045.1 hypothetical protein GQA70_18080 [Ponticoccus alexandrii]